MEELEELYYSALSKLESLNQVIEEIKSLPSTHQETMEDILYELNEIRTTIEDQIT
jgi:cAMP phosphodiesterase